MINSYFSENTLQDLLDEIRYVYMSDERPWIIGYSGGKDSTVVTHLVYTMLKQLLPEERHKTVYIVSTEYICRLEQFSSDLCTNEKCHLYAEWENHGQ